MGSADKVEELIKEIAVKHGIAVSRDDPIMILQTINERLMRDNAVAQEKILAGFKEELEMIAYQWGIDAKDKAERILNAAITSSKQVISNTLQEGASSAALLIRAEVAQAIAEAKKEASYSRSLLIASLTASIICFFSSIFLAWIILRV